MATHDVAVRIKITDMESQIRYVAFLGRPQQQEQTPELQTQWRGTEVTHQLV